MFWFARVLKKKTRVLKNVLAAFDICVRLRRFVPFCAYSHPKILLGLEICSFWLRSPNNVRFVKVYTF